MEQVTFRLKPGQLLREEIQKAAKDHKIQAGVLLSAVGSLDKAVLRMAGAKPDQQDVRVFEEPFEIVSATGTLSADDCHIHIALSDRNGQVIGGHLKNGCVVGVTAEVVIGIFDDVRFNRKLDQSTGFEELTIE